MKVVIVFHSVCGNTYLMANAFAEKFSQEGHQASLYRVKDSDWVLKEDVPEKSRSVLQAMTKTPEARPDILLDADLIIYGSPVYFGNVSAEMKAFMDATGGLWFHGKLTGKKFAAFVSAGNTEGGGDLCLQVMHTYGKYMGMFCAPLPIRMLPGENTNALGIIQYSNGKYPEQLDDKIVRLISAYASFLVK